MTQKYISTELLIIFTALMIIANFYYIFFEKIGFLFVLLLGSILMYVGYIYFHKVRGLLCFWIGALMVLFTLLSNKYTLVILFIFMIIVAIRYIIYKRKPLKVMSSEDIETSPALFKQKWFGEQKTPVYVYKWEDVQIQHGMGDIYIDMTKAANLKAQNTIVVRHIVGKVQVVVPLNYNVKLNVSAFCGNVHFEDQRLRLENNNIKLESAQKSDRYTVNVFVSTFIGDVEVIGR
ncbi:cell wall-active antibiotics response protein LiaF [Staphylococcus agnetis]|uniref:cell wall-active antibiotics response protein VraT n=1 Tax=Staphylococcus agnetis TaxID=985762 RepID=UPI00208FA337|nr:cell wall-active antibiotics response protein LiaF [Staphylococcus agnetis]MCO4346253.1 cell wall-active antibiotics response protein LiaF [Staphylococcus agnetis]MCO4355776.1 cell wall-active antibiotics response protein LiaF [Staphylococcus agnetis]MCO4360518.1 cell wall-active antibiotics response protein LiaF [Staphylococcus agnetis]MCO4364286.1 cell wall-active antibiotics response protein LiaF [Staphylococcus agnetis]MCO4372299.1 cell wall-active antibiotics response protein LiaF [Sta